MQSQHVTRADEELVKMRDITTNTEIPGAPDMLEDIDDLSGVSDVNEMARVRDRRLTRRYESSRDSHTSASGTRSR